MVDLNKIKFPKGLDTSFIDNLRSRVNSYFDEQKIRTVANRVDAEPVIVPLYVGGAEGIEDYFQLVDRWIDSLLKAADKKGLLKES